MKRIKQIIPSPGLTGFYFDDQAAIKHDAAGDGLTYKGQVETEGFTAIRQAGESISLMILLDDGQVAYGDCAAVQYSGAGGRDPLFLAREFIPVIEEEIAPVLTGLELNSFRELAGMVDSFQRNGRKLHTALRYGITQALLDAVARAQGVSITEIVAREYNLEIRPFPVPIFCQTGDDRYLNADKMIIKHADVLPHGLINNVNTKLGRDGQKLVEYIIWLKKRIKEIGDRDYQPVLHIDVYGTIGQAFDENLNKIVDYFSRLEEAAYPLKLRVEGPIDRGNKENQIMAMCSLREGLAAKGIGIDIVADEWCNTLEDIREFVDRGAADMIQIKTPDLGGINNTIEAVLYCRQRGIGAYQGGTCNETDRSAQISTDIAIATRPDQILAKPGMGVDEGLMIVFNEMQRILALLKAKGYR